MELSLLKKLYSLILVTLQFITIGHILYLEPIFSTGSFLAIQVIAMMIGVASIFTLEPGKFNVRPIPKENGKLHTHGAYRFIRHPMYSSLLLFFAPTVFLSLNPLSWLTYGLLIITLLAKLHFEESLLIKKYPDYEKYQLKTKKLIPFIY
ncbi:MAG TPA: hypothetical protein DD716_04800 [Thiomicrospira sp.]|jgi:protein-S-isoprenylcysteine O-methyltransferase Ste14|nr:hypothetical protein [Thiomicrospira sp.]